MVGLGGRRLRISEMLGFIADDALVVTTVMAGSDAERFGVKPGLSLLQLNRRSVTSIRSWEIFARCAPLITWSHDRMTASRTIPIKLYCPL